MATLTTTFTTDVMDPIVTTLPFKNKAEAEQHVQNFMHLKILTPSQEVEGEWTAKPPMVLTPGRYKFEITEITEGEKVKGKKK